MPVVVATQNTRVLAKVNVADHEEVKLILLTCTWLLSVTSPTFICVIPKGLVAVSIHLDLEALYILGSASSNLTPPFILIGAGLIGQGGVQLNTPANDILLES
ncbi:hypothetical protein [Rickettsia canadensis]|uniref:hypothetical protein n=1 Tax=Rickettsia canadensis TaxID=788 RepID=UPI0000DADC79|nr:hypothetical protein [Rickettsia canadensis]